MAACPRWCRRCGVVAMASRKRLGQGCVLGITLPIAVCVVVWLRDGKYVSKVQPRHYSVQSSRIDEIQKEEEKGVEVVVISSLPRSGSTLLAQILATPNNSVLFFEPLSHYQKVPCFRDGSCVADFMSSLFRCTFDDKFDAWLKGKGLFVGYYHSFVDRCFQWPKEGSTTCRRRLDLRALCRGAHVKVVKVIRSRLVWLEALVNGKSNVKIIYLTRDPRGSLVSISRMGWDSLPSRRCAALIADLDAYSSLSASHPDRIIRLSLEEFSQNPFQTTQRLFDFLYGSSVVDYSTRRFLFEHTNASRAWPNYGNMDTHRNSARELESWRKSMTSRQLFEVEQEQLCRMAITRLGHTLFTTLDNARNFNISLYLKTSTVPNL